MLKIFNKNTQKKEEIECESEKKTTTATRFLGMIHT